MRASIYIRKKELENYLEKKNYKLITLRKIVINNFGYKTGKQFRESFPNITPNVLDIKLAYINDAEYEEILVLVSDMIKYLEKLKVDYSNYRVVSSDIIFRTFNSDSVFNYENRYNDTLYPYTISRIFRKEFLEDVKEKNTIIWNHIVNLKLS